MSETLFRDLWKPFGKRAFVYKITDTKEVTGQNRRTTAVKTKPQPSDFVVTFDGETFYVEVKSSENPTSFPFSNIRPTQIGFARMIEAAGGKYFFYILRTRTGEWFKVPAGVILNIHSRRSMTWDELQEFKCAI